MAGLYPDIPGTRFALDQDGTIVKARNYTTSGSWSDITASVSGCQSVNTANYLSFGMTVLANATYLQAAFAFPEARDIAGIYCHPGFTDTSVTLSNLIWESSTDTTDGTDGTWSSFTVSFSNFGNHSASNNSSKPYYRSDIASVSLTAIKGIRVRWTASGGNYQEDFRLFVLHLYGSRSGSNRVAFWDPSADQALAPAYLDFGDIAQGSSVTRQFRIKNLAAQTANGVVVSISDLLTEFSGNVQVSTDNTTFSSSVNIGNLTSGTISSVLYIRRTVPAAETPTQHSARLLANATSWT